MGNLKGAIFFMFTALVAISVWAFNVVYADNALPQILTNITTTLPNPIVDMTSWAQLFITLERLSPLFIVLFGLAGWILEILVFGRNDYGTYTY
jgi:hypothetical protein